MLRAASSIALLALAASLSACSPSDPFDDPFAEYGKRILTVTPTAGNAQAANTAIQTINPWPRYAYDTRIPADGAKMAAAVEAYEGNGRRGGGGSATININTGSGSMVTAPGATP